MFSQVSFDSNRFVGTKPTVSFIINHDLTFLLVQKRSTNFNNLTDPVKSVVKTNSLTLVIFVENRAYGLSINDVTHIFYIFDPTPYHSF